MELVQKVCVLRKLLPELITRFCLRTSQELNIENVRGEKSSRVTKVPIGGVAHVVCHGVQVVEVEKSSEK